MRYYRKFLIIGLIAIGVLTLNALVFAWGDALPGRLQASIEPSGLLAVAHSKGLTVIERQSQSSMVNRLIDDLQRSGKMTEKQLSAKLAEFSQSVKMFQTVPTVQIATNPRLRQIGHNESAVGFHIPAHLLQRGSRGTLGAIVDLLRETGYEIRPEIANIFDKSGIPRLFSNAS